MLLLSGCLVVVGNQVVMLSCSDSEPLSCSGRLIPTQEVFKSGWDLDSAATVFAVKLSEVPAQHLLMVKMLLQLGVYVFSYMWTIYEHID